MASSFFLFFFFSPPPFLRRSFHCLLLLREKLMQHVIRSGSNSHIIWSTPRNHEQPWQYHPPSALSRNCEYSFKPFFLTWTFLTDETKVAVQTSIVLYWAKTLHTK